MNKKFLFTSESVSEGHPDKMADQISDAVLDAYLSVDPEAKVACECLLTKDKVIVAGEVHANTSLKKMIPEIVRNVIRDIGYDHNSGYEPDDLKIVDLMNTQSSEIRMGVEQGGAGDQGLMFGHACNETPQLMPYPITLAHNLLKELTKLRKNGNVPWLLPDAKSQVTVLYENGKISAIDSIVISTQHWPHFLSGGSHYHGSGMMPHGHYSGGVYEVTNELIADTVINDVIKPLIRDTFDISNIQYHINPSGSFTLGGPAADTGLTGRKIIVDTYGGSCPHGGGAFSGKDASKVDRSGAYMARWLAKNIVASGVAEKCTVQLAYIIAKLQPVSLMIDTHNTEQADIEKVRDYIVKNIDLSPNGIIQRFELKNPVFKQTACYGHFGREEFKWEHINPEFQNDLKRL